MILGIVTAVACSVERPLLLATSVLDSLEELIGPKDGRQGIEVAELVALVGGIVLCADAHRLAHSEPQVQQGEVVLAGEVEDPGAGRKPAGVDLRDARPTGPVFSQVEVEGPGGY